MLGVATSLLAWLPSPRIGGASPQAVELQSPRAAAPTSNLFADLFDNQQLKKQTPPARPLLPALVSASSPAAYVLQEKMFSLSGEDFRVRDVAGREVITVEGANINLGGFVLDKLGMKDAAGKKFCSVERRAVAASTSYDIYDLKGELIAKVERELVSATPKYNFYYEGGSPFAGAAYHAEGSFFDRAYTFYSKGDVVARTRRAPELMRDVDSYQVTVAAGVDAAAVLAMAVIIDEDHDETDAKKEREGEGGAWPF